MSHPVYTGAIANFLPRLLNDLAPSKVFVLVDSNTRVHCLPRLKEALIGYSTWEEQEVDGAVIAIKAGELDKTIASAATVWQALIDAKADRKAVLLTLGGGVVTDLGGFAAGCYKRGIRFVHLPTTVLAQVDAAIGGKTGVDFGNIKNSVGLFRMPEAVLSDPAFLLTLPAREIRSGMAEMYKHALISDAEHWIELKAMEGKLLQSERCAESIAISQRIKGDIVAADPEENGIREALNFGHSIGHALESMRLATDDPALHGEAVAAGMICETFLSQLLCGLSSSEAEDIQQTLLRVYGKLPFATTDIDLAISLVANDKKNRAGESRMSLLSAIGKPALGIGVNATQLREVLHRYISLPN